MTAKPSKHPGGRPTSYRPEYCEEGYNLALLGLTDEELAKNFGIAPKNLYEWQKKYPEFRKSLIEGKIKADGKVARKLYERATGAEWTEQQAFKVKIQDAPGMYTEEVRVVDVKRAAPPDTQACTRWLTNRDPNRWKDKQDVTHDQPLQPISLPTIVEQARAIAYVIAEANRLLKNQPPVIDNA